MSKAADLLYDVVLSTFIFSTKQPGPGQIVLGLPDEKRTILKRLKSAELQNMRPDAIWAGDNPSRK